jgi:hypothetical protein
MNFESSLLEQEILEKALEATCLAGPSQNESCLLLVQNDLSVGEQGSQKELCLRSELVMVLAYVGRHVLQMERCQNQTQLARRFWRPELHGCAFPHT